MVEPTGYSALDLIGFTDRGPYAANVNYVKNDLVHHGGNIWRVLIDDTMGITPKEGVNYTVFIGEPTNLVERIIAPLETNPATIGYTTGRQIIYNDYLYEVIADIAIGDSLITYETDPTNANIKLAPPVETQLLAVRAEADATDNMIAPTEASASSSSAPYSVGDQLILNNILYDVIAAIQIGDALTTGAGGNIKAADTLTDQLKEADSQIQTLTNNDDAMLNELGAKNLLPNTLTSQTSQGITFTVNSDGSVTINGVLSGTVTYVTVGELTVKEGQKFTLNGADVDDDAHVLLRFVVRDSNGTPLKIDGLTAIDIYNGERTITIPSGGVNLRCSILVDTQGTSVNNVTFYPMIRPASVADNTYVPYAMTNRELTDKTNQLDVIKRVDITSINNGTGTVYLSKRGGVCTMVMDITPNDATTSMTFTLPYEFKPESPIYSQYNYRNDDVYVYFYSDIPTVTIAHTTTQSIVHTLTYVGGN